MGSSLWMWQNQRIQRLTVSPSPIHKISKVGAYRNFTSTYPSDWILFETSENFEPILSGTVKSGYERVVVVRDKGLEDGVEREIFGRNLTDFQVKITFLDALWWAMGNENNIGLDRFIQEWNVSVTATEEYPHFKPATARKGFIHAGIHVLPRQTCGLYTYTQLFDEYPEGFDKVQKSIEGGDLFFTILLNPISIFMTHQQNYAHDRLALYTFENLFRFLKCWTNIRLKWQDPTRSAQLYFQKFPEERTPLWTNPCMDPRHQAILPPSINCTKKTLPDLLIIGPQKTGSTALASFLSLHPNTSQNIPVPGSFEEIQFFGGNNYLKGVEWYMSNFPNTSTVTFEKSATYFDNPSAPKQAASLIPHAKLVVILQNPTQRAYSWLQHLLAHKDPTALAAGSLESIILEPTNATSSSNEMWRKIKQRCISGGRYVHHLDKWLEHFSLQQIIFIDSDELKSEPVKVLNTLSKWLDLPEFPFETHIRFSPSKGFHCRLIDEKTKCLGESKGRKYEEMSESLRLKLNEIFALDNSALYKFLRKNRLKIPIWLEESVRIRA